MFYRMGDYGSTSHSSLLLSLTHAQRVRDTVHVVVVLVS